ncbi:hypothetical protein NDU88_003548 [Pleurodeles waltl]|uniref:Uncharacterized protein n=1 Tax=Pleurodeles waltl TaxID=8319 RepID=A0AAV7REL2_PLEWA|nr:hypothetical protein NDU88_003548 [Pleurodeles waltl]
MWPLWQKCCLHRPHGEGPPDCPSFAAAGHRQTLESATTALSRQPVPTRLKPGEPQGFNTRRPLILQAWLLAQGGPAMSAAPRKAHGGPAVHIVRLAGRPHPFMQCTPLKDPKISPNADGTKGPHSEAPPHQSMAMRKVDVCRIDAGYCVGLMPPQSQHLQEAVTKSHHYHPFG